MLQKKETKCSRPTGKKESRKILECIENKAHLLTEPNRP